VERIAWAAERIVADDMEAERSSRRPQFDHGRMKAAMQLNSTVRQSLHWLMLARAYVGGALRCPREHVLDASRLPSSPRRPAG